MSRVLPSRAYDNPYEIFRRWDRAGTRGEFVVGSELSLASDHQRRDHRDDLSARREERLLHDDAIRLVGSDREPQVQGARLLRDLVVEDHRHLRFRLRRSQQGCHLRRFHGDGRARRGVRRAWLQRRAGGRLVRQAGRRRPEARRDELQPFASLSDCQRRKVGREEDRATRSNSRTR